MKLTETLLVAIEQAVRGFPRFHKYAAGAELRTQARAVARIAHRAWRDQARRPEWIGRLVFAVDDLKLELQIAQRLQAFRSFKQFEAVARLAHDLGRQCGGWQKQQGQNRRPDMSAGRAQTLSARDTRERVNP